MLDFTLTYLLTFQCCFFGESPPANLDMGEILRKRHFNARKQVNNVLHITKNSLNNFICTQGLLICNYSLFCCHENFITGFIVKTTLFCLAQINEHIVLLFKYDLISVWIFLYIEEILSESALLNGSTQHAKANLTSSPNLYLLLNGCFILAIWHQNLSTPKSAGCSSSFGVRW